ncbi:hypothetical protein SEUCBS139899_010266 [Sporothrix eucalyptigena]
MAEVAGLILGGIPLVISAVEIFAEPLESYRDYYRDVLKFHSCLKIQRKKLEITLSNIGLDNPTKDELCECVKSKFPDIADEILCIYECIEREMVKIMRKLGIDPHTTIDTIPRTSLSDLRRIWNSISAKRRKATISLLKELNEQLCDFFQMETFEVKAEDDDHVVQSLIKRFNINHCDALRLCLASLHRALASSLLCACAAPHHVALDMDWHLESATTDNSRDDGDVHGADDGQVPSLVCQDDRDKFMAPNITVFALGILLVELCVGKPFAHAKAESQQQHEFSGTPATTVMSRYEFAMNNLDKVYELAGESYGDAAKKCIRFSFPGRDSQNIFDMQQFRATFYRQVVAPVQAAYSKFPN